MTVTDPARLQPSARSHEPASCPPAFTLAHLALCAAAIFLHAVPTELCNGQPSPTYSPNQQSMLRGSAKKGSLTRELLAVRNRQGLGETSITTSSFSTEYEKQRELSSGYLSLIKMSLMYLPDGV